MIVFEHEEKEYRVKNLASEVNLKELSHITQIMEGKGVFFDKWLQVVSYLGSPELSEIISSTALLDYIRNFKVTDFNGAIADSIELDGFKYVYTKELSGKDLSLIEKYMNEKPDKLKYVFSIVYKREDLSNKEHYSKAHIEHKVKLFEDKVSGEIANPVIIEVSKKIIENIEAVSNASK
jgi:hypothetical protein